MVYTRQRGSAALWSGDFGNARPRTLQQILMNNFHPHLKHTCGSLEGDFQNIFESNRMSEPEEECDNCHKMFPESKIPTHFGYCRRNIKKCAKCGEMYDINFQEEHEEDFHKKAKCQYCKREYPASETVKHQKLCPSKPMFCEYCEQNVPAPDYPAHLRACQSRTKKCDKCLKSIMNKDYLVHLTTCPGYVEEKPKTVPTQSYNQYVDNTRDKLAREKPKKEEPVADFYSKDQGERLSRPIDPVEYQKIFYKHQSSIQDGRRDDRDNRFSDYRQDPKAPQRQTYDAARGTKPVQSYNPKPGNFGYDPNGGNRGIASTSSNAQSSGYRGVDRGSDRGIGSGKHISSTNVDPKSYKYQQQPQYAPTYEAQKPKYEETIPYKPRDYQPTRDDRNSKPSISSTSSNQYQGRREQPPTYTRQSQVPTYPSSISSQQQQKPRAEDRRQPKPQQQPAWQDPKPQTQPYQNDHLIDPYEGQNFGQMDELERTEQMMIWQSMKSHSQQPKGKPKPQVPKQFEGVDIMNQSFYKDVDIEKQKAIYEQLQRKNRRY